MSRGDYFEEDDLLTVDLAIHEVANSFWVWQDVRHSISDALPYLALLFELVKSAKLQVVGSGEPLLQKAFDIASRNKAALYDSVFVALALQTGLPLRTLDERQRKTMLRERGP